MSNPVLNALDFACRFAVEEAHAATSPQVGTEQEDTLHAEPLTLEQLKGRRQAFRNVRLDLARRVQKDFDLPTIPFHNRHTERKFWKTEYRNLTNKQTTK